MKTKDGRYVIDRTTILEDYLLKKSLYVHVNTKEIVELDVYEQFMIEFGAGEKLIKIENEKVAKALFKDSRHRLPRTE